MSSFRSKPLLALSVVLLLAFSAVTRLANFIDSGSSAFAAEVLNFLRPGWKNHPVQWLVTESTTLLAGAAAVVLLGLALPTSTSIRFRTMRTILTRGPWRLVLWAILLGHYAPTLVSLMFRFDAGLLDPTSLLVVISWLGFISPLAAIYCSARLLFGTTPWRADRWLGYLGAAATLFGLSWQFIALVGLGDFLPRLGRFAGGDILSLGTIVWFVIGVAATWTDLVLARRGQRAMLGRRDYALVSYIAIGGFVLSALEFKIGSFGFLLASLPLHFGIGYVSVLVVATAVVLLCILHGAALLAGDDVLPDVTAAEPPLERSRFLRRILAGAPASRFWADLRLSLVVTLVLIGIAFATVGQIPLLAAAFVMPLIVFGFLIGPIVVFVTGVLRGRPGFAAAPVIVFLALVGYRYGTLALAAHRAQVAVEQAATLNIYPFAEASRMHDFVVIEDSHDNRGQVGALGA